jgi:zinc transporter, ZIP family
MIRDVGARALGGRIGVAAVTLIEPLLPWTVAFAAGAMLFVISSQTIPETRRLGSRSRAPSA